MFKKILLILITVLLLIFIFKDSILVFGLEYFLNKDSSLTADIGELKLSLSTLQVKDIKLKSEGFTTRFKKLWVDFSFPEFKLSKLNIEDAYIRISDLEKTKVSLSKFSKPSETTSKKKETKTPLSLNLKNITFKLDSGPLAIDSKFSLKAELKNNHLQNVDSLTVDSLNIKGESFSSSLRSKEGDFSSHTFFIDELKFKDKSLKDIAFNLEFLGEEIVVSQINLPIFGLEAKLGASVNLADYNNICFLIGLKQASFKDLISFFGSEDKVFFDGPFSGQIKTCFSGGEFSQIKGNLSSEAKGIIDIKKELSFEALKRYLDKASYQALVDSFKHYAYNSGAIGISQEQNIISLDLNFDSEKSGSRNIKINYHKGGRK